MKQSQASFSSYEKVADILYDLCDDFQRQTDTDEDLQRTFTISQLARSGETIEAEINTGEFGLTADFYDVETGKRIPNARDENHAEEFPFRMFYHTLSARPTHGLLILEIFQNRSVRALLEDKFEDRLESEYGNSYLEIRPVFDDRAEEKLNNADRFIELTLEGQEKLRAVDNYAADGGDSEDDDRETLERDYVFKPGRGESIPRQIVNAVGEKEYEMVGIKDEDYEDAKITIVEDNNEFTFSLWEDEIRMRLNVKDDDEEVITRGGKPTAGSIQRKSRQLANLVLPENERDLSEDPLLDVE